MNVNSPMCAEAPVALIIFNRPDATKKVIEALRSAKIRKLFVVADGPRIDFPDDINLCMRARHVIDEIDWPCEVTRRFLEKNIGCGHGPSQGLDWIFQQTDRCIILEDDCIPSPSFFPYCNELLEKFKDDKRVMMVSGNNHLLGNLKFKDSYCFSVHTQTHGWATWARAWNEFDFYISDWPSIRSLSWLSNYLGNKKYAKKWITIFDQAHEEARANPRCSFWDFQWTFACWKNSALNIIPSINLVSNIGYGEDATHPTPVDHPLSKLPASSIEFPLRHPQGITRNYKVDKILRELVFGGSPLYKKIYMKLIRIGKRPFSAISIILNKKA